MHGAACATRHRLKHLDVSDTWSSTQQRPSEVIQKSSFHVDELMQKRSDPAVLRELTAWVAEAQSHDLTADLHSEDASAIAEAIKRAEALDELMQHMTHVKLELQKIARDVLFQGNTQKRFARASSVSSENATSGAGLMLRRLVQLVHSLRDELKERDARLKLAVVDVESYQLNMFGARKEYLKTITRLQEEVNMGSYSYKRQLQWAEQKLEIARTDIREREEELAAERRRRELAELKIRQNEDELDRMQSKLDSTETLMNALRDRQAEELERVRAKYEAELAAARDAIPKKKLPPPKVEVREIPQRPSFLPNGPPDAFVRPYTRPAEPAAPDSHFILNALLTATLKTRKARTQCDWAFLIARARVIVTLYRMSMVYRDDDAEIQEQMQKAAARVRVKLRDLLQAWLLRRQALSGVREENMNRCATALAQLAAYSSASASGAGADALLPVAALGGEKVLPTTHGIRPEHTRRIAAILPWFPHDLAQLPQPAQLRMLAEFVSYVTNAHDERGGMKPRPPEKHVINLALNPSPKKQHPRARRVRPRSAPLSPRKAMPVASSATMGAVQPTQIPTSGTGPLATPAFVQSATVATPRTIAPHVAAVLDQMAETLESGANDFLPTSAVHLASAFPPSRVRRSSSVTSPRLRPVTPRGVFGPFSERLGTRSPEHTPPSSPTVHPTAPPPAPAFALIHPQSVQTTPPSTPVSHAYGAFSPPVSALPPHLRPREPSIVELETSTLRTELSTPVMQSGSVQPPGSVVSMTLTPLTPAVPQSVSFGSLTPAVSAAEPAEMSLPPPVTQVSVVTKQQRVKMTLALERQRQRQEVLDQWPPSRTALALSQVSFIGDMLASTPRPQSARSGHRASQPRPPSAKRPLSARPSHR
eukprot:TRINITY_DN7411_c0_g2_i2.p1 TRINITY_DN7411_c0_g2~~TRINITY_DN7411_c0_g2_i2.p1  ORF type:complete len:880 (+),score=226.27 TRINITY_DN7411_c0_g2_i2:462-3101(+)